MPPCVQPHPSFAAHAYGCCMLKLAKHHAAASVCRAFRVATLCAVRPARRSLACTCLPADLPTFSRLYSLSPAGVLQIMEEVMAKSKAYKAERNLQREEDAAATQALDDTFRQLVAGPALGVLVRPKGVKACALLPACSSYAARSGTYFPSCLA